MSGPRRQDRGAPAPVTLLAAGQLLAWGTLYYGIGFLARPIEQESGWGAQSLFAAFSAGLLTAALLALPVGRLLTRHGGRAVMSAGSLVAALAFTLMAVSGGPAQFTLAWLVAGAAMAMTLYEAAFSTLRESTCGSFRRAVGRVTLVGGLASTLFWPLTDLLATAIGWRATAALFALLHLAVGWPLHRALPPRDRPPPAPAPRRAGPAAARRAVAPLAAAFALAALATSALSAHMAVLLAGLQLPAWAVPACAALMGPTQAAARLLELRLVPRLPLRAVGLIAFGGLALSLLLLTRGGTGAAPAFGFILLFGAANGLLTVVRGGAPAELLPGGRYAADLALLSAPGLAARALGPWAAAAALAGWGAAATLELLLICALLALLLFAPLARPRAFAHPEP